MIGGKPKQLHNPSRRDPNAQCQKCLKRGHMTYQCTNTRPYQARPSRSDQLKNGVKPRDKPSVEIPDEFKSKKGIADKILAEKEAERAKDESKKSDRKDRNPKKRRTTSSDSDSDSETDSDSNSSSPSSSISSRSRSRSRSPSPKSRNASSPMHHHHQRQRRRQRRTSTSDSESDDHSHKGKGQQKQVKRRRDDGSPVRSSSLEHETTR